MLSSHTTFRVALMLIAILTILWPIYAGEIGAIDFTTDYKSDPLTSKYKLNYIKVEINNPNEPTNAITFCFRIKPYSTIAQCVFKDSGIAFKYVSEKYGFLLFNGVWIMFQFKKDIVPLKWYHVCVSYDNGYVVMILNGDTLINEGFDSFKNVSTTNISFNHTFTLGFCKENSYGPSEAITRGMITDFNMWPKTVSAEDMTQFTNDCLYSIKDETTQPIILWKNLSILEQGTMAVDKTISLKEICGTNDNRKTSIILPIPDSYKNCKKMCQKLGGNLPVIRSFDDLNNINETISEENRNDKDGKDRLENQCSMELWMPIIQNGKDNSSDQYLWFEDVGNDSSPASFLPWELSQPNGQDLQQCVTLSFKTNAYTDIACERKFCCLCAFEGEVNFHLHGMPETSLTDTHYIFVPQIQKASELIFTGYKQYQISWKSEQQQWQILDRSDLNKTLGYHNITHELVVIGKYDWNMYPDEKSTTKNEQQITLKFSKVNCFGFKSI